MTDALGNPVDDSRDHHAAVTVAGENHVVQILEQDQVHHIINVGLQIDVGAVEVHALAEASKGGAVNRVAIVSGEISRCSSTPTRPPSRHGPGRT